MLAPTHHETMKHTSTQSTLSPFTFTHTHTHTHNHTCSGGDKNSRERNGETALLRATRNNHVHVVQLLLDVSTLHVITSLPVLKWCQTSRCDKSFTPMNGRHVSNPQLKQLYYINYIITTPFPFMCDGFRPTQTPSWRSRRQASRH